MHWSEEQLIASLYGVGPEDGHLSQCEQCTVRRTALLRNRQAVEAERSNDEDVAFEFLAAQRRVTCQKLEPGGAWPSILGWRRWVPVMLTLLILGGGAVVYRERHVPQVAGSHLSDAQLALEVSRMSQDWQAPPTAPLQELFE
jgi:hypothetical protein